MQQRHVVYSIGTKHEDFTVKLGKVSIYKPLVCDGILTYAVHLK